MDNIQRLIVNDTPTVDVVEMKHGEWIKNAINPDAMREFHKLKTISLEKARYIMATVKQVIDRVELLDTIHESVVYRWLGQLDGRTYTFPEDKDTELKIKEPDDSLYDLYLKAMNTFFMGDLKDYQDKAIDFQLAYQEYLDKEQGI